MEEAPAIVKNASKISSSSVKSKKIRRVIRRKPTTRAQERQVEEDVPKATKRRGPKKLTRQASVTKDLKKTCESLDKVEDEEIKYEVKNEEKDL